MKKTLLIMLAAAICLSAAACGEKAVTEEGGNEELQVTTTDSYPIENAGDVTLRWWMYLPAQVTGYSTSMNDTEFHKFLEESTGVKISFEHPVAGQEQAAFNILQASDDMPDIIESSWSTYAGGPQKAIENKVIIPLNEYIEKVSPNLKKIFQDNPEYAKQMITDDGYFYQYPFIRGDEKLSSFMTFIIRQDLLDKAGLEKPETIDEWETVLRKFKEMGIEAPVSLRLDNYQMANFSPFMACYGIAGTFYHDKDNKVKFGPYEPEFADWVKKMAQWYQEGLLDQEFSSGDSKRLGALVTNGNNGAIFCTLGGEFGNWLAAIPEDSEIRYEATKIPTQTKGEPAMYAQKDFPIKDGAAISYTSKNKEIAARVLDYAYSKEGQMMYNFGKENVSYTGGDENPTYTDIVVDSDKNGNLTMAQALSKYCRAYSTGPYVQDVRYLTQYYQTQEQKDALNMLESDTLTYKLPILTLTGDEMQRYNDIMSPIDTYRQETITKIIAGKLPISELDNYYAQLKSLGIEEAIQIQQQAYDRFLNREVPELK